MPPALGTLSNARPSAEAGRRKALPREGSTAAEATAGAATAALGQPRQDPASDEQQQLAAMAAKLSLEDASPADSAAEQHPELAAEASVASTAAADSPNALNSPLAAFAAAKARLTRSNSAASSLISALGGVHVARVQTVADEAAPTSLAAGEHDVNPRQQLLARTASGSSGGSLSTASTAMPAVAALHQRNMRLKERLQSTMELCHTLHEQNRESIEKVAQLHADNQRLSRSLLDSRLDKEGLQHTIRQITTEAGLLAQQARRALLPAGQLDGVREEAAEEAAGQQAQGSQLPASAGPDTSATTPAAASSAPGSEAGTEVKERGSQARSEGGGSSSGAGGSLGSKAVAASPYAHGLGSAAGDKRRRLGPALAAALAEAEAGEGAGCSNSFRLPTPTRTPKRKVRQSFGAEGSSTGGTPAAAPDPAADPPAAAAVRQPALDASPQQPQGGAAPGSSSSCTVLAAVPPAPLAATAAADEGEEEGDAKFETFALFEHKWFGGGSCGVQQAGAGQQRRLSHRVHLGWLSGCSLM